MIKHIFKLKRYNWTVIAYYGVTEQDYEEIYDILHYIQCPKSQLNEAMLNIRDGMLDNGFTYTNYKYNISVVIVGYGSNDNEFMNTLVHEARHVEQHISNKYDIDTEDEERYYLIGKLVKTMYSKFKLLLQHSDY